MSGGEDGNPIARHDLLRVAPEDWDAALRASAAFEALEPDARRLLSGWAARGRPAIARRRASTEAPGALPLGVPLPPRFGKLRFAVSLPRGTRAAPVSPPDLGTALAAGPGRWAEAGALLAVLGASCSAAPRVFGSLLWQAVTGLGYVGPGSDLDLLWRIGPGTALSGLLDGLARIDGLGIVPIDGEILLPGCAGVQWRELERAGREPGGQVLAKTMDGVALLDADALMRSAGPAQTFRYR